MSIQQIQHHWLEFQASAQIKRPTTEKQYLELHDLMQQLTNQYAMNDPIWGALMDIIATYMLDWENQFDPWAKKTATPRDVLASLIQDRQLTQVQLEQAGVIAQSTLSQILSGQRGISQRVAQRLAGYFGVPVSAFLSAI